MAIYTFGILEHSIQTQLPKKGGNWKKYKDYGALA